MRYATLQQGFADIALLKQAMGVLYWDSAVMMPPRAAEQRGKQIAYLEALAYEKFELLAQTHEAEGCADCPDDAWHQVNLKEMLRQMKTLLLVPKDLQRRLTEAKTRCEMAWRQARSDSDFSRVERDLMSIVTLTREALSLQAEGLGLGIMDAAIAAHEPYLSAKKAQNLLEEHATFLQDFLPVALEKSARRLHDNPQTLNIDVDVQQLLCRAICQRMGLPQDASRIDVSAHPFSSTYPHDSRITIRFDATQPLQSLMAAMHETGHSLYDLQLPAQWSAQPVGQARGMTLHESQSLCMEKQAGLDAGFLTWLAGLLHDDYGAHVSAEQLCAEAWKVARTPIRVTADEVTYPLHVLLRFRLEKALLEDQMPVRELPTAFRDGLSSLLDVHISEDRQGCLQDIHWYLGEFGYFPCYALGAMAAAQLTQTASIDNPRTVQALSDGDFAPIQAWMQRHVHAQASLASTDEILMAATRQPLHAQALRTHLTTRYL